MSERVGIDPRGPRFGSGITAAILMATIWLALTVPATAGFGWFAYQPLNGSILLPPQVVLGSPGFVLLVVVAVLYLWGVLAPRSHPWALLYRALIQKRLPAPARGDSPGPLRFAQGVGLVVSGIGLILVALWVPFAVPLAAGAAFVAEFLNAAFGFCVGCKLYLLLQRIGPAPH